MPTRMRGSAMVLATEPTGVNAFAACGGTTFGGGGVGAAHAASRVTATAHRTFMAADYAITAANREMPSRIRSSGSFANVNRIVLRPLPSTKNGAPGTYATPFFTDCSTCAAV